eukprot:2010106-Alexandrium_andersonii.AAC.1
MDAGSFMSIAECLSETRKGGLPLLISLGLDHHPDVTVALQKKVPLDMNFVRSIVDRSNLEA